MEKRQGEGTKQPPSKRPRLCINDQRNICTFCHANVQVTDLLEHLKDDCPDYRMLISDYRTRNEAIAKYGERVKDMEKLRLCLHRDCETPQQRKKLVDEYLEGQREVERRVKQRKRDVISNLLRIPIVCTLPSCSREESVSIRGLEVYERPVRTVVVNEKRPIMSRFETDAIKLRAMFLDGVPLSPADPVNIRKTRTVPALITLNQARTSSTSSSLPVEPIPGPSRLPPVRRQSVIQQPVLTSAPQVVPSTSNQLQTSLPAPSALKSPLPPQIRHEPDQIVSGTMNISNVPITVTYRIPPASPLQMSTSPQLPQQPPLVSNGAASGDTGLRISSVMSLPQIESPPGLMSNNASVGGTETARNGSGKWNKTQTRGRFCLNSH